MISSKQLIAIEYLASGKRISEVSDLIGVSRRSISKWIKRDDFALALEASKRDAIKSLSMKLITLNEEALAVAQDCLHSRSESIRLRAVSIITNRLSDAIEISVIHDEIDRINQRLDNIQLKRGF